MTFLIAWLLSHPFAFTAILLAWFYVAMFTLRRRRKLREKLGPVFYVLVGIVLGGLVLDFVYQWTVAPALFGEFTWHATLSQRLEMYRTKPEYHGTRKLRWADFICERLLNKRDVKGHHC